MDDNMKLSNDVAYAISLDINTTSTHLKAIRLISTTEVFVLFEMHSIR